MKELKFGVLTVSDSCHCGDKVDTSGPTLAQAVRNSIKNSLICIQKIVPDHCQEIADTLIKWTRECDVILTTGGTGLSPRDVTPEATRLVISREVPGISYAMLAKSLEITSMAMLSRAVCGVRDQTLIINLPGSAKGAVECFTAISNVIPHAVDLILDRTAQVQAEHGENDHRHCNLNHNNVLETKAKSRTSVPLKETDSSCCSSKVRLNPAERPRESAYKMWEVADAQLMVLNECDRSEIIEIIPIEQSQTRVLAEDIIAERPIPPFRASIKDGYAVLVEDGMKVRIIQDIAAAGDQSEEIVLLKGKAVRISTGAALPSNANAVVQVEDTQVVTISENGEEQVISIKVEPKDGQDIREIGSDVKIGEVVLKKFTHVSCFDIGVMAMLGKATVKVFRRKSIGIISSGNELRNITDTLQPGQIIDSNKLTLIELLKSYGYDSFDCGIARDNPDSVKKILAEALSRHEVIISSGGVSMGEFDLFKQVLTEDFGANIHFGRVNMKPGKPTVFATVNYEEKLRMIFCLPGNPVSCSVTSLLFVVPALRFMEKRKAYSFPIIQVDSSCFTDYGRHLCGKRKDNRPEYVRVNVHSKIVGSCSQFFVTSTGNQISSRLNSMVGANGLLIIPGTSSYETFKCIMIGPITDYD